MSHCCCYCSVTKPCPTFCDPMDWDFPVLHYLLEFAQTHVHWVDDAIQPSHPLLPCSTPALNLFQHQGLFQWVSSSHQMAKVLELQLQHQPYQWIFELISFRMDWFDLHAVQGTFQSSPAPHFENFNSLALSLLYGPTLTSIHDCWKNHSFDYTDFYWQIDVIGKLMIQYTV